MCVTVCVVSCGIYTTQMFGICRGIINYLLVAWNLNISGDCFGRQMYCFRHNKDKSKDKVQTQIWLHILMYDQIYLMHILHSNSNFNKASVKVLYDRKKTTGHLYLIFRDFSFLLYDIFILVHSLSVKSQIKVKSVFKLQHQI
jgi:hypothetical protein